MSFTLLSPARGIKRATTIIVETDFIRELRIAELVHYRHAYREPCNACGVTDGVWVDSEAAHLRHTKRCA